MTTTTRRLHSARLAVRMTPEDRQLIDQAAAASGTPLNDFVVSSLRTAALDALAGRTSFVLDEDARLAWEELNQRPARELVGLEALLSRPSPFADE